jgi:hypothetical protein
MSALPQKSDSGLEAGKEKAPQHPTQPLGCYRFFEEEMTVKTLTLVGCTHQKTHMTCGEGYTSVIGDAYAYPFQSAIIQCRGDEGRTVDVRFKTSEASTFLVEVHEYGTPQEAEKLDETHKVTITYTKPGEPVYVNSEAT